MNSSCAFKSIQRSKHIVYQPANPQKGIDAQKLNVFAPKNSNSKKDVFIFIHGGNWNSGNRNIYNFFGTRLARKDIVSVVISYPLSPKATYREMASAAANAVKWVHDHIENYGGDPGRIFISGHSAGGHLASLVSLDNRYFDSLGMTNPIKGTILIDAAGLDMYTYLREEGFEDGHTYLKTFTNDQEEWKRATPIFYLHQNMPPMLIYTGGKTYPSIKVSNEKFIGEVLKFAPATKHTVQKNKRHVPMILQYFFSSNPRYKEIIAFIKSIQ